MFLDRGSIFFLGGSRFRIIIKWILSTNCFVNKLNLKHSPSSSNAWETVCQMRKTINQNASPASTAALEAPTAAPSLSARSYSILKLSPVFIPLPPLITTFKKINYKYKWYKQAGGAWGQTSPPEITSPSIYLKTRPPLHPAPPPHRIQSCIRPWIFHFKQ